MGNGALPNGPSYRAHPQLYRTGHGAVVAACPLPGALRKSHFKAVRSEFDPQRTSFWLWPALASALVANDWTVELTGLITSRSQRKLAPGRRPQWGRTRAKGGPTISIVVSSLSSQRCTCDLIVPT